MNTYRAEWPIEDDSATLRDLTREALDDFAQLVDDTRHIIRGPIRWGLREDDDGALTLTAEAPVHRVTHGTYRKTRPERRTAA